MNEAEKDLMVYQLKDAVKEYFIRNHSDEFGYVSEKLARIEPLTYDDAWVAIKMLHPVIKKCVFNQLPYNARRYLIDNELFSEEGKLI